MYVCVYVCHSLIRRKSRSVCGHGCANLASMAPESVANSCFVFALQKIDFASDPALDSSQILPIQVTFRKMGVRFLDFTPPNHPICVGSSLDSSQIGVSGLKPNLRRIRVPSTPNLRQHGRIPTWICDESSLDSSQIFWCAIFVCDRALSGS